MIGAGDLWSDGFMRDVENRNTKGQGLGGDVNEACFFEQCDKLVALDECVDRLGQVFVCTTFIAGDQGGCAGHDVAEVEVVEAFEDWVFGQGELEDDDACARNSDTVKLAQGGKRGCDVADAEGNGQYVGGVGCDGQAHGVTRVVGGECGGRLDFGGLTRTFALLQSGLRGGGLCGCVWGWFREFLVGYGEHVVGEVEAQDFGGGGFGECEGQVAGASGDVEDEIARLDVSSVDSCASPCLVAAKRMQTVIDVIAGGDGGKHALDTLSFVSSSVGVGEVLVGPGGGGEDPPAIKKTMNLLP